MTNMTRRQAVTAALCTPAAAAPLPAAAQAVADPVAALRAAYAAWRAVEVRLEALHQEADACIEVSLPEPAWRGRNATLTELTERQAAEADVEARFGIPEAEDQWCEALDAIAEAIVRIAGDTPARVWDMIDCVQCRAGRV